MGYLTCGCLTHLRDTDREREHQLREPGTINGAFWAGFGSRGAKVLMPRARVDQSLLCLSVEGAPSILTGWPFFSCSNWVKHCFTGKRGNQFCFEYLRCPFHTKMPILESRTGLSQTPLTIVDTMYKSRKVLSTP